MYIPLHVHTTQGSIGDSILKIKEYVKKAKAMGLTHISATNHGSMADMYEFYYECVNNEIKPIIGCEVYTVANSEEKVKGEKYNHLVLIAKNAKGLENLLYITSQAQLRGMYYKPRTDLSIMRRHGEGIIALSACLGGDIPQKILALRNIEDTDEWQVAYDELIARIAEYNSCFDEYYLDYRDRGIVGCVFDNTSDLGYEEAWQLGYIKNGDTIAERYFDYEKFGEDLLEDENYFELSDGRVVTLNY